MQKAKVITALGMFYDLESPSDFIRDVASALAPDGVFIAQLMCLKQTIEKSDIGNFAHEHLEFYSLKSLGHLFGKHGLQIFDIEENNVNGGSYRLHVQHEGGPWRAPINEYGVRPVQSDRYIRAWFDDMNACGLDQLRRFKATVEANKIRCVDFIRQEVALGKRVWVYGASTKGNVILQWYGLDHRVIEAASERSSEKWGKYTIGSGIPIKSEDEFRQAKPDYALVLPYAFLPEFLAREQAWRDGGGKFIVPLPEFRIV